MDIPNPEKYFGKWIKVHFADGHTLTGEFDGFCYDYYDDTDEEYLELTIETYLGTLLGFSADDVEDIEVIDKRAGIMLLKDIQRPWWQRNLLPGALLIAAGESKGKKIDKRGK